MESYRIIKVTWRDAMSHDDVSDRWEAEKIEPLIIESVGFLVISNEEKTNIAGSVSEDGCLREVMSIANADILKKEVIR